MELLVRHPVRAPAVPIVATLPHSGTYVPEEIAMGFEPGHHAWLRNTDWHLQHVYDFLPDLGITVLEATHSRYVADLNRNPAGPRFGAFFAAVVAERTAQGAPVYAVAPTADDLATRVSRYHAPFHAELAAVLRSYVDRFGRVVLLDLHSFMGPIANDVCLGDGGGTTCTSAILGTVQGALGAHGFDFVVNTPFSGGHLVRCHGALPGVDALQVELRYTTYLDCARIDEPVVPAVDPARIQQVQARLRPAFQAIAWAMTR